MARLAPTFLTLAALAGAPGASASRADCWPEGSATLKQSRHARVYRAAADGYVHACLYSAGRRVRLSYTPDRFTTWDLSYAPYRLAGPYVAHLAKHDFGEAYVAYPTEVEVIDLRTGHLSRSHLAWGESPPDDPERTPQPHLAALELTRGGSVAWIASELEIRKVWRADSRGPRQLDEGKSRRIPGGSLRVRRGQVRWENGGVTKVASFR
jgi:hypothetical protein